MDIPITFQVMVYGKLEPYNEVLSKARCRIFYKYANRNGAYITDQFAEQLIKSLPYVPVKGIYDNFNNDYTDHGKNRDEGRIYGIVPETYNFAWEKHLDEDGIEREYACSDVLIFTALYKEASEIVGKSLSMELYAPSITGNFQIINGIKYFVYNSACFLGLQVLGDEVTPCFEGAAFYSLYNNLKEVVEKLDAYNLKLQNEKNGGPKMDKINFRLSDSTKFDLIFDLLNTNYNEDGGWTIDYCICDVYDDYVVAYNYGESIYERVYYTKNEDDSVSLGAKKRCYILDVTEEEKNTLETIQQLNGGSFTKADEVYSKVSNLEEQVEIISTQNAEFGLKIEEYTNSISTLTTENETLHADMESLQSNFNALETETKELREFKLAAEEAEKKTIIDKYAQKLPDEVISKYSSKIVEFTALDLDKELAYEMVNNTPDIFSFNPNGQYVPQDFNAGGIEEILTQYQKKTEE